MNILHVVAGLWKEHGGPSEVIPNLCSALVDNGCKVTIATVDGINSSATEVAEKNGVKIVSFAEKFNSPIRYTPGLKQYLREHIHEFDVVHNHGHWLYPNWVGAKYARKYRIPMVTTPHGTLVPGMLEKSSVKKTLAWIFCDRNIISYATKIHALTAAEKTGMKDKLASFSSKIVVIPNGTFIPKVLKSACFFEKYNIPGNKKVLLFLSRVHPIKGIFDLMSVWCEISSMFPEWHIAVVGPSSEDVSAKLNAVISGVDSITVIGPLYDDQKILAYKSASAFILPSYAEGLPTVILEAAANHLPILCTEECNFPELNESRGSLEFKAGRKELKTSLISFLQLSDRDRAEIGENAFNFIQNNYTWGVVAKKWISTYSEITKNID
jgi:glycosyltransferase involved in cell wall biosynthesis